MTTRRNVSATLAIGALLVAGVAVGGERSRFECAGKSLTDVEWARSRVIFESSSAANEYSQVVPKDLRAALISYYDAYVQEDIHIGDDWKLQPDPVAARRLLVFFSKVEMHCYYLDFSVQELRADPFEMNVWTKVVFADDRALEDVDDGALVEDVIYTRWVRAVDGWRLR